jgi:hypothetical protein
MSKFFRDKGVKKMSRDFRDLASHCVKRLTPDHLNEIKVQAGKHFYRAVLEVLFVRHGIDSVVGRTPNSVYLKPFVEYVRTVVRKHRLSESLIEEADIIYSYAVEDALASMILRRMCAGVLESLIILDRCMAVREALIGGYVGLHMLFERETSPRGWAIVASRS